MNKVVTAETSGIALALTHLNVPTITLARLDLQGKEVILAP
ncbi:MAG: hypothetical protein V7722_05515 [Porticoccus sp.]